MKKEQSSIEFLIDNLKPIYPNIEDYKLIIRLAKDSHKKEIIGAVTYGNRQEFYDGTEKIGEKYYTEKYEQWTAKNVK